MKSLHGKVGSYLGAVAIGGSAFLTADTAAAADNGDHAATIGLTLSYSIGARRAFGIGLDLRYTYFVQYSADEFGVGAFFQPTYLVGGAWRFAGGIQATRLIDDLFLPTLEVGASYRTTSVKGATTGGWGLHLGAVPIVTFVDLLPLEQGPSFRGVIGLSPKVHNEFIIGHDFRAPGACFYVGCLSAIPGRPLRTAPLEPPQGAALVARASQRSRSGYANRVDLERRQRLAAHFARDASMECASIPAFLALARDLARASAPAALVARARRSAAEEAVHTTLCAELAGEFGEFDLAAIVPPLPFTNDRSETELLARLAVESFWDGCIGEGAAAALARRQCAATELPSMARAFSIIARDEQAHADLSAMILAFCLDRGGNAVRNALHASIEERIDAEEAALDTHCVPVDELLVGLGIPDAPTTLLAREEALARHRLV